MKEIIRDAKEVVTDMAEEVVEDVSEVIELTIDGTTTLLSDVVRSIDRVGRKVQALTEEGAARMMDALDRGPETEEASGEAMWV